MLKFIDLCPTQRPVLLYKNFKIWWLNSHRTDGVSENILRFLKNNN